MADLNDPDTSAPGQSGTGLIGSWKDWIGQPENRAGLLQFGLQMMQPVAPGQSGVGAFAASIGEGAEARDRHLVGRAKAEETSRELDYEGQRAQAYAESADSGLSLYQLLGQENREQGAFSDFVGSTAKSIAEEANDPLRAGEAYPEFQGKTELEIQEHILRDPEWNNRLRQNFDLRRGRTSAQPEAPRTLEWTAADIPTQNPQGWERLKRDLRSSDPAVKSAAQQRLQRLKGMVSDPENLEPALLR